MPVTKTARRALRSSLRKAEVNGAFRKSLEISLRVAKKTKSEKNLKSAVSLTDRAAKRGLIHKNKAARIKSALAKLSSAKTAPSKKSKKK